MSGLVVALADCTGKNKEGAVAMVDRRFEPSEITYRYFCIPHEGHGMIEVVIVV